MSRLVPPGRSGGDHLGIQVQNIFTVPDFMEREEVLVYLYFAQLLAIVVCPAVSPAELGEDGSDWDGDATGAGGVFAKKR